MASKLKSVLGSDASLVDGCMRDSKAQVRAPAATLPHSVVTCTSVGPLSRQLLEAPCLSSGSGPIGVWRQSQLLLFAV